MLGLWAVRSVPVIYVKRDSEHISLMTTILPDYVTEEVAEQ